MTAQYCVGNTGSFILIQSKHFSRGLSVLSLDLGKQRKAQFTHGPRLMMVDRRSSALLWYKSDLWSMKTRPGMLSWDLFPGWCNACDSLAAWEQLPFEGEADTFCSALCCGAGTCGRHVRGIWCVAHSQRTQLGMSIMEHNPMVSPSVSAYQILFPPRKWVVLEV